MIVVQFSSLSLSTPSRLHRHLKSSIHSSLGHHRCKWKTKNGKRRNVHEEFSTRSKVTDGSWCSSSSNTSNCTYPITRISSSSASSICNSSSSRNNSRSIISCMNTIKQRKLDHHNISTIGELQYYMQGEGGELISSLSPLLNNYNDSRQYKHKYKRYIYCRANSWDINIIGRSFTTTTNNNGIDGNNKNDDKDKMNSGNANDSTICQQQQNHPVDKEFVDYLTGNLDDITSTTSHSFSSNLESTTAASSLSSTSPSQPQSQPPPPPSSSSSGTKADWFNILLRNKSDLGRITITKELNETYKNIERTQTINIEKSRKARLITVRRALGGNVIIALSKLAAFLHSGSSAMMSEFVHSVVDCGNQSLLLVGLRDSGNVADRNHSYGYGKSIYFWALVSALGTFFLGAGVSMTQALPNLMYGSNLHEITWHVWTVLGFSFAVDGYVFTRTLIEVRETMPKGRTLWTHVTTLRDPATLAILLEDGAACLGVVIAIGGLGLTQAFDMPVYDALAGVGISGLLATMGLVLVRVNHRFLLGQSVDKDIQKGIEKILLNRKSIDAVHSVQSQWTGAETFSFKAEVDFDGTFLAAKLMPRYQQEFAEAKKTLDQDLRVLLSWYAEDVMRTVEREVRNIEAEIRREYPGAQYIELEPMSKDADRFAIDDGLEASLKRIEIESLNRYLKSLYQKNETKGDNEESKK